MFVRVLHRPGPWEVDRQPVRVLAIRSEEIGLQYRTFARLRSVVRRGLRFIEGLLYRKEL